MMKEGFLNAYRNRLMSLISISMVVITLIIFGIYNLFMFNLNYNMKNMKKDYQIQVYCNKNLDYNDPLINDIENKLKSNSNVQECIKVSKEEAYEKLKNYLDDPSILEGMSNDFLPVKFTIKLKDSAISLQTSKELEAIPNIDKVSFSQKDMDFINTLADWMHVASILIAVILLLSSVFIISIRGLQRIMGCLHLLWHYGIHFRQIARPLLFLAMCMLLATSAMHLTLLPCTRMMILPSIQQLIFWKEK
jgi:cell division transport system permease protein